MNESRAVIPPNIIIQQDLVRVSSYGVAMISRLLKMIGFLLQNIVSFIGLVCKRALCF